MTVVIQKERIANVFVRLFRGKGRGHGRVHVDLQNQHAVFLQIGVVQVAQQIGTAILRIKAASGPQRFPGLRRALNGML